MDDRTRGKLRSLEESASALSAWVSEKRNRQVVIDEVKAAAYGVSNETFILKLRITEPSGPVQHEVQVLRITPTTRGVLEPYDIARQYRVMSCLEGSSVPVPRMHEIDETGSVLGRPFYTMEYLSGTTIQPPHYVLEADQEKKRRMSIAALKTMAAVHTLDWRERGLDFLADATNWPEAEIQRWETRHRNLSFRVPALDEVVAWLKRNGPSREERTLVHGDIKLANFMWNGEDVVALLDWEMAGIGDPLSDLAYYLAMPTINPQAPYLFAEGLTRDETIRIYQELTGFQVNDLSWYEALNFYKIAVILATCLDMFSNGDTDDLRYFSAGMGASRLSELAARSAGLLDLGPFELPLPSDVRLAEACLAALEQVVVPELVSETAITQAKAVALAMSVLARGQP